MKKNVRIVSLLLAATMVATMAGSVIGAAANGNPDSIKIFDMNNNEDKVSITPATFTKDDTITEISFIVRDTTAGIGKDKVTTNATVTVDTTESALTGGIIKVAKIETENAPPAEFAKYKIVATGMKAKAPGDKLVIKVKDTNYPETKIVVPITGFDDGTGTDPDPAPPTTTDANARYSVTKVSQSKNEGGVQKPGNVRFNINEISGSSNASIYQTYFADVTVKVSDKNLTTGLGISNIMTTDMGSFVFSAASESTVVEVSSSVGYCEIKFTALRYTGNGKKLTFKIVDNNGNIVTASADITECVTRQEQQAENDKNNNDSSTGSKLEVETPYIIVNKYGYGGGSVVAGETFTLSMTFQNTSQDLDVTNMMITLTMPDDLMLTSSSNTFYVPELAKQKSITKAVQVTAKSAAKVQSHNIGASMKYQYVDERLNTRKDATTTENIAIPVVQVDRFEVTAVEIPMDIMLEEETSVTVSYVNKGRSEVYNLAASIDGNILNPGQNQNLGNLLSGATGSADFFIKPNEAGQVSGTITITYEDTNMEQKVATIPYNATVKTAEEMAGGGMGGMMPGMGIGGVGDVDGPVEPEKKSVWPVVAIVAVVVLIPVGLVVKKKLDQKRKEREDADL